MASNPNIVPLSIRNRRQKLIDDGQAEVLPPVTDEEDEDGTIVNIDAALAEMEPAAPAESAVPLEPAAPSEPVTPAAPVAQTPAEPAAPAEPFSFNWDDFASDPADAAPAQAPAPAPAQGATGLSRADVDEIVAPLLAEIAQLKAAPPLTTALAETNLTDSEREAYSEGVPVMQKVARAEIAAVMAQMEARFSALENSFDSRVQGVSDTVAHLSGRTYEQQRAAAVPDMDALIAAPAFRNFLATTIPFSGGVTVRSRLAQANSARDVAVIKALFDEFRPKANIAADPALANMQQPGGGSSAAASPAAPAKKRRLAWSKRGQAHREYLAGRMTEEKFNQVKALYATADAEGLIDYDK
jgi:hypothetical protein